jgi:hypothetical protein
MPLGIDEIPAGRIVLLINHWNGPRS